MPTEEDHSFIVNVSTEAWTVPEVSALPHPTVTTWRCPEECHLDASHLTCFPGGSLYILFGERGREEQKNRKEGRGGENEGLDFEELT